MKMKKVVLTFVLFFHSSLIWGAGKNIILGADPFCPFNCLDSKNPGFVIEVAKAIFEKNGYSVSYLPLPWLRAIEQCEEGKITAVIGGIDTPKGKFPKTLLFPRENIGHLNMIYGGHEDKKWKFTTEKDLQGKKFGWVAGYEPSFSGELGDFLKKKMKDTSVVDLSTGEEAGELNIKKLLANRINTVVEEETVFTYLKNKEKANDLIIYGNLNKKNNFYLVFSPKDKNSRMFIQLWDQELPRMRKDGRLKKILDKYKISDWK